MKIEELNDRTIVSLTEKDVREAIIQYIENWNEPMVNVPKNREFIFEGERLKIHLPKS